MPQPPRNKDSCCHYLCCEVRNYTCPVPCWKPGICAVSGAGSHTQPEFMSYLLQTGCRRNSSKFGKAWAKYVWATVTIYFLGGMISKLAALSLLKACGSKLYRSCYNDCRGGELPQHPRLAVYKFCSQHRPHHCLVFFLGQLFGFCLNNTSNLQHRHRLSLLHGPWTLMTQY